MDIPLDEVLFFDAITSTPATGAAVDADAPPTFAVYEESTDTDIGIGGSMTKRTSLMGNYRGTFTASAANGFELGKWYSIVASGVVGGVTGKAVLKNFRVVAAETIAGTPKVDAVAWLGTAAHAATVNGVPVVQLHDSAGAGGINAPANFEDLAIVDTAGTVAVPATQKVDVETIKTRAVQDVGVGNTAYFGTLAFPTSWPTDWSWSTLTQTQVTGGAYDITNATPVAALAAGVWRDAVAGDFAVASSIGKSLYTGNYIPGAVGGFPILVQVGSVATIPACLKAINNTSIAGTTTLVAAAFLAQYNVASPVFTNQSVNQTADVKTQVPQVLEFTTDGNSHYVKADAVKWGGAALPTIPGAAPTAAAIVTAMWTALLASTDFATVSSIGKLLKDQIDAAISSRGTSTLDAAGVRTAVGMATANLDTQLGDVPTVTEFNARTIASANYALASICTEARLAELDAANLPTDVAARTGFKLASDGVDAIIEETGMNMRQAIAVIAAAAAGKLSGAATTTITIKAAHEGLTSRVVATVDADGNRSAVTLTLPA